MGSLGVLISFFSKLSDMAEQFHLWIQRIKNAWETLLFQTQKEISDRSN